MKKIPLTQGFFALVSDEDYPRLSQHKWYASVESRGTKVYAVRRLKKGEPGYRPGKKTKVRMHREVLNLPPLPTPGDPIACHLNDDSLDNRRENLVEGTHESNMLMVDNWRKKGQKVGEPCL